MGLSTRMGVALASVRNKIDRARMLRIVRELDSECQGLLSSEGRTDAGQSSSICTVGRSGNQRGKWIYICRNRKIIVQNKKTGS